MNTILITGGFGFLGRHAALAFKKRNYQVIGLGHGDWDLIESQKWGFSKWISGSLSKELLNQIDVELTGIVHCGGGSSVGRSIENPEIDFYKTVTSTEILIDYIVRNQKNVKLVYPSSAAVHGEVNTKINEDTAYNPVSPYGLHKMKAEESFLNLNQSYKNPVGIIRFFSLYGEGLKKQLLWDACTKFSNANGVVSFWGAGDETRDWLHVTDAAELIFKVFNSLKTTAIINGGSGESYTLKDVLSILANNYNPKIKLSFNGITKNGDPKFFAADISRALELGWKAEVALEDGLIRFVNWFKTECLHD